MNLRTIIISLLVLISSQVCTGQAGFYFGPKGGLTIGTQNWNETDRKPLLSYHLVVFIESIDIDYKGSLFAQLGYMTRGSALTVFNINNGLRLNDGYKFRNLSLTLGAKKRWDGPKLSTPYYFFGVRAEYNVGSNLAEFDERFGNSPSALFYPKEPFVNAFTYGVSMGGGIEFLESAYVQPTVEFTIAPDLSYQYQSPEIPNVISPYDGSTVTIPERRIRNVTFEISFIVRFLREVIYVD